MTVRRQREYSTRAVRGRSTARFPRIGLVGVVLLGVGFVEALVAAFAAPMLVADHHGAGDAHLLAFLGMVLVFVGLLRGAQVGATRRRTAQAVHREDSDAIR